MGTRVESVHFGAESFVLLGAISGPTLFVVSPEHGVPLVAALLPSYSITRVRSILDSAAQSPHLEKKKNKEISGYVESLLTSTHNTNTCFV